MNIQNGNSVSSSTQIKDGIIVDADINASAAIAYSKLNLLGAIVNTDIAIGAAISVLKLASAAQGDIMIADGAGAMKILPAGTSGKFLETLGENADPAWGTPVAGMASLGSTIAAGGETSLSVNITAKKNIVIFIQNKSASSGAMQLQFNGDTGTNYEWRWYANLGAATTNASTSSITIGPAANGVQSFFVVIPNIAGQYKPVIVTGTGAGPATLSDIFHAAGLWRNNASQINSIALLISANSFSAGSYIEVFGAD